MKRTAGQATVEWVGLFLAASVVVGALIVAAPSLGAQTRGGMTAAVCRVTGGSCPVPPPKGAPAADRGGRGASPAPTVIEFASSKQPVVAPRDRARELGGVRLDSGETQPGSGLRQLEAWRLQLKALSSEIDAIRPRTEALKTESEGLIEPWMKEREGTRTFDAVGNPVSRNPKSLWRLRSIALEIKANSDTLLRLADQAVQIGDDAGTYLPLRPDWRFSGSGRQCDLDRGVGATPTLEAAIALEEDACGVHDRALEASSTRGAYFYSDIEGRARWGLAVVRDGELEATRLVDEAAQAKQAGKDLAKQAAGADTPEQAADLLRRAVAVQRRFERFAAEISLRQRRIDSAAQAGALPSGQFLLSDFAYDNPRVTFDDVDDWRADVPKQAKQLVGYTAEVAHEIRVAKRKAQKQWPQLDWTWIPGNLGEPGG